MAIKLRNRQLAKIIATTQGKTYTTLFVTVAIAILLFVFAIVPAYLSITNKLQENKAKEKYIKDIETNLAILQDLSDQEAEFSDQINLLNELYPLQSNDELIASNLEAMAKKYSCSITNISFADLLTITDFTSATNQFPNLVRANISIVVSGNLENLQFFISHIERFPITITINSVTYSKIKNAEESADQINNYSMTIDAQYFYWKKL